MKTFESCGLTWIECDPNTKKPDWLPDDALVRWLHEAERDGKCAYIHRAEHAAWFFGTPIYPELTGWYPVTESLVPQWLLDGVDEPPKGWRYYGGGPVRQSLGYASYRDIAVGDADGWCTTDGYFGTDGYGTKYAVREGSDLYKKIWPELEPEGNVEGVDASTFKVGDVLVVDKDGSLVVTATAPELAIDRIPVRTAVTVKEFLEQHPEFVLKSVAQPPPDPEPEGNDWDSWAAVEADGEYIGGQPPALLGDALSAVREWTDELGMTEETYLKVRHFVEWYYSQTEGGVK